MTIIAAPAILSLPSRFSLAPIANTQSGGRSPLDGTEQTLRMPGERWAAQLGFEGLTQEEWRPLLAFVAQLGGRAGRFTWSPPLPRRAAGLAGRTNWVTNGEFTGAGVGATGAGWTLRPPGAGGSVSVAGTGVDVGGERYIDLAFAGNMAGAFAGGIEMAADAVAAPGQSWTGAMTFQTIGGVSNVTQVTARVGEVSAGVVVAEAVSTTTVGPLTSATRRTATRLMAAGTSAARLRLDVRVTPGAAYAMTLRVELPQLERAAAASAYIPTTPAGPVTVQEGPFVNGAGQAGTSLALRGWLPLAQAFRAGDLLGFTDTTGRQRLHMATADATASEAGLVTVPIAPPIRRAPADGATVTIVSPLTLWRLSQDRNPMEVLRGLLAGNTLDIEEAIV